MSDITKVKIRMYKTGTGDCFALKFYKGNAIKFRMMIDGGTWSGKVDKLSEYVEDLKSFLGENLDVLVVTHEHKDHVHLFDVCEDLFTDGSFSVDSIWMAWTEDDKSKKIAKWKKEFGQKKMALAAATQRVKKLVDDPDYKKSVERNYNGVEIFKARKNYSETLQDFAELHFSVNKGGYTGGLKGMENVKKKIKKGKIEYWRPGDIVENNEKLSGVKFYVLGPPEDIASVKKEKGRKGSGDTYEHNKDLEKNNAFAAAIMNAENGFKDIPFKYSFVDEGKQQHEQYGRDTEDWRRIDNDWLYSSGMFALRMNSATNNLSLAIAIEIGDSGKVLLFPGDAEFGSWASWHNVEWSNKPSNGKHFTEDLLNRTVFYKVAHHLSQNGTAKELGMKMLNNTNLNVMATLDYDVISSRWTGTMPNRDLLKDIIVQTKGRFIVMNEKDLFYDLDNKVPLSEKILEERKKMTKEEQDEFNKSYVDHRLYHELTINF